MARRARATSPGLAKGEQRQAEILAVARGLLVEEGYDAFVMREVCARVGLTLGNLQYYYATRDDLLEAVVRAEFARNQSEIDALAAAKAPPRRRLAAIARHLIDVWAHEGGRVYAVMSLLALHQARFATLHGEIYAAFYEKLLPVLKEIRPRASKAELRRTARLITTMIDGALVQVPGRTFVDDAIAVIVELAER